MEYRKIRTNEFICRAAMEKQTQTTDLRTWGGGEGKENEIYGESNMETYIIICKIDSQWEFAVWLRELKKWLCINLEGWQGEGDGSEV